ncbi:MAG: hypothetical protein HQL29_04285 [Candidatus Omnitrophica bacterium]|nr:hypothetical protein [Candidatus Omnitrophota bacterium]
MKKETVEPTINNSADLIPEEKLLHIIEGGNTSIPSQAPIKEKETVTKKTGRKISFKKFSFSQINIIAMVILFLASAWLIIFFYGEISDIRKRSADFRTTGTSSEPAAINLDKGAPQIKEYLSYTNENNPFQLLPQEAQSVRRPAAKPKMELSLVGIFWDDKPQAVIEDAVNAKNYMVYTGDSVGDYKVGKITYDSVELISNEENKILR